MSVQKQILNIPIETYNLLTIEPSFNLNITVNSSLPLTYSSANFNVVTVDQNGNVNIEGSGKTVIRFSNNGNAEWAPVDGVVLLNITKRKQSIEFFYIDNKYTDDPPFNLNGYGYTNSGLPLKYRSLNPNIAEIFEDGLVIIKTPGTLYFEAYQEGNFEWDSVSIIKELGISPKNYPFNLELTPRSENTLLKLNIYKNENNNLILTKSISGGLYFGTSKVSLIENLLLPTGSYIGILNYENIPTGSGILFSTTYSFSHKSYTGCKNKDLYFLINRSGFIDYGIDLLIKGELKSPSKYASQEVFLSGILWSGFMKPKETGLLCMLPIFENNKIETNTTGDLSLSFVNFQKIPLELRQTNINQSIFVLNGAESSSCTETISQGSQSGLLPISPKNLGIDFTKIINKK